MEDNQYVTESVVRGHHVYKDRWTPRLGETLQCLREEENRTDRFAVAVYKDLNIVGHVPRAISTLCSVFLRRGGIIRCVISGNRQHSHDLPQGGLEVPCKLYFMGNGQELKKIQSYFTRTQTLTFSGKSDMQQEQKATSAGNIQNISIEHAQCSSSAAIATSLPSGEESAAVPEIKDECTSVLPNTSTYISLKSEDYTGSDVPTLVKSEDPCPEVEIDGSSIWVTHDGRHSLHENERLIIEQGCELNDKHIGFAQSLIKSQFPLIGGLVSTLLQHKSVKGSCAANTIQIIHCEKRKHWIVASTKWCKPGDINIYDTLFSKLDAEGRAIVKQMFGLKQMRCINMVKVQKQQGTKDCGLFAIAMMTSLAHDEDPSDITYDQSKFRSHRIECFVAQQLTTFPRLN